MSTAVCLHATANSLTSSGGHSSAVVVGTERDLEPLRTSVVLTTSQSAEREFREAKKRQHQQEKQTQPPKPKHEDVPESKRHEAEEGKLESPWEESMADPHPRDQLQVQFSTHLSYDDRLR